MSTVIIINGGGAVKAVNRLVNLSGYMDEKQLAAAKHILLNFEQSASQLVQRVRDSVPNLPPEPSEEQDEG